MKPTSCFLIFIAIFCKFQIAIGQISGEERYYMTNTQFPVFGNLELDKIEAEPIILSINSKDVFFPGYYLDSLGEKIEGEIKQTDARDEILFRLPDSENEITLTPSDIHGYRVGIDSFFVFHHTNEMIKRKMDEEEPVFVKNTFNSESLQAYQYLSEIDNDVYLRKFFVYQNSFYWFPEESADVGFKKQIELYKFLFGENKFLRNYANKIDGSRYSFESALLTYHLYESFVNKKKTFLDHSYRICSEELAKYYLMIDEIDEKVMTVSYYLTDGTRLSRGSYLSFWPSRRKGKYEWFYSDQSLMRKRNYQRSDFHVDTVFEYYPNGNLHCSYVFNEKGNKKKYLEVLKPNNEVVGNKKTKEYEETLTTIDSDFSLIRTYRKHKMLESTINYKGEVFAYQIAATNAKWAVSKPEELLERHFLISEDMIKKK